MKLALIIAVFCILSIFHVAGTRSCSVSGNPEPFLPLLAMPEEYIDYTITRINGTLWAKISGTYPIHLLVESNDASQCSAPEVLPMVYPIPPGTTNISVKLNGTELSWSNYTQTYPDALHHTAIGDWAMIYCLISPVSNHFVLTIHYEHPLAYVNGSYLFLYDLNIEPYLSSESNSSMAYFTVRFETEVSNVHVYFAESDSVWNQKNFTRSIEEGVDIVTVQMHSVFGEMLAGDLVVMFSEASTCSTGFPYWMIVVSLVTVAGLLSLVWFKKKQNKSLSS
jgi:hypothetical protein